MWCVLPKLFSSVIICCTAAHIHFDDPRLDTSIRTRVSSHFCGLSVPCQRKTFEPPPIMSTRLLQGREPLEFLAFAIGYAVLVVCCLVPTCIAYRRRRRMERRLVEQQAQLQRRLQESNLVFLRNMRPDAMSLERMRTEDITAQLDETTMVRALRVIYDCEPLTNVIHINFSFVLADIGKTSLCESTRWRGRKGRRDYGRY